MGEKSWVHEEGGGQAHLKNKGEDFSNSSSLGKEVWGGGGRDIEKISSLQHWGCIRKAVHLFDWTEGGGVGVGKKKQSIENLSRGEAG